MTWNFKKKRSCDMWALFLCPEQEAVMHLDWYNKAPRKAGPLKQGHIFSV